MTCYDMSLYAYTYLVYDDLSIINIHRKCNHFSLFLDNLINMLKNKSNNRLNILGFVADCHIKQLLILMIFDVA